MSRYNPEEPYGTELYPTDPTANTHQFTGHERDAVSGNDYMRFRFYQDAVGRFLRPDNVAGSIALPHSWNRYAYVHGNPIIANDPTGHLFNLVGSGSLVSMFMQQIAATIGMPVYTDNSGNVARFQGPPAPGYVLAMQVFDQAASAPSDVINPVDDKPWGSPKFTIEVVADDPNFGIDSYCCLPGQKNPLVSATQLEAIPTKPPSGKLDFSTRGEFVTHILGEYTVGSRAGEFTSDRLGLGLLGTFKMAHEEGGLASQNRYRAALGQSAVKNQVQDGHNIKILYESGNMMKIKMSEKGTVTGFRYGWLVW